MQDFFFYIKLGLQHVLDLGAYDHILFLTALALPFTFKQWKPVVVLATIFTISHCLALAVSVYDIMVMDVGLIEFLIPVTIVLTAIFNILYLKSAEEHKSVLLHGIATAFFGLIHGFGFSTYFKMLMAGEDNKLIPLLGFASGIEIAQVIVVLSVLSLAFLLQSRIKVKQSLFVLVGSILVILITLPILIETFPW